MKYLKNYLYNLINKTNGNLFCFMINIILKLKKKNFFYSFDSFNKMYKIDDGVYSRKFYEKTRHIDLFRSGIESRGLTLGKEYLLNKIDFRDDDLVVDCGANIGDLKLYFDIRGVKIRYIGIEPSPKEYLCLVENVGESNSLNVGIYNQDGELSFYVSSAGADSSFIEPPEYEYIQKTPVVRLDTLNLKKIKLLKIEAEGAEPEIILGSLESLRHVDYVVADLGPERGILKENTFAPVANLLLENGFKLLEVGYPRLVGLFQNINYENHNSNTML